MRKKRDKILYIYAGMGRRRLRQQVDAGVAPSTSFFGLIELQKQKVDSDFVEVGDVVPEAQAAVLRTRLGFNLPFILLVKRALCSQTIVSSAAFPLFFILQIFPRSVRPRWIILNINLTNLIRRNTGTVIKKRLLSWMIKRVDGILCVSRAQATFLRTQGVRESTVRFVPFGTDAIFWSPLEVKHETQKVILSVGRDNGRDYATLLKVARMLPEHTFVIVASKRNLPQDAFPDNVELYLDVDYLQLREFYRKAHAVVIPTRKESFLDASDCSGQTVLLDAMASGKPVVVSEREYLSDYLKEDLTGYTVPPEDPYALAQKIKEVLDDEEKAAIVGLSARKAIEQEFNTNIMAVKIVEAIKEISPEAVCPVCGSSSVKKRYEVQGKRYLYCATCDLVFMNMRDRNKNLSSLYEEGYFKEEYKVNQSTFDYFADKEQRLGVARESFRRIAAFIGTEKKRLLEVGCAAGYFLVAAREQGHDVAGVELSRQAAAFAQKEFGLQIVASNLAEVVDNTFNVVAMFHTLEHLEDPVRDLRRVYDLMTPGGMLIVEVPNIRTIDRLSSNILERILSFPYHLYVFSPKSLQVVGERAGFICVHQEIYFSTMAARFLQNIKNVFAKNDKRHPKIETLVPKSSLKKPTYSWLRVAARRVFPGSNMLMVFRKPGVGQSVSKRTIEGQN